MPMGIDDQRPSRDLLPLARGLGRQNLSDNDCSPAGHSGPATISSRGGTRSPPPEVGYLRRSSGEPRLPSPLGHKESSKEVLVKTIRGSQTSAPPPTEVMKKCPLSYQSCVSGSQIKQRVNWEPESHNKNSKYTTEPPYLFLKNFGQGGAVCQLNEPHHVSHCPLQRVALQNEPLLLLLLCFLQRRGKQEVLVSLHGRWGPLEPFLDPEGTPHKVSHISPGQDTETF